MLHQITADLFLLARRSRLDSTSGTLFARGFTAPRERQEGSSVLRQPLAGTIDSLARVPIDRLPCLMTRPGADAAVKRWIARLCFRMLYTG